MKTIIKFSFLLIGLLALNACKEIKKEEVAEVPTERPNILFIMSDDHAYQAISAYNDRLL